MKFFIKLLDLILYSNFFIALAATTLIWQTNWIIYSDFRWTDPLSLTIFNATLFVYTLHRLIGVRGKWNLVATRRFSVIKERIVHIQIYGFIALAALLYFATKLSRISIVMLGCSAVITFLYLIPVFKGKRLRDLPLVKVFTVGLVWTWVTVALPMISSGMEWKVAWWPIIFEKLFFIVAITIPFDIRDLTLDSENQILTMPNLLGVKWSNVLSIALLVGSVLCALLSFIYQGYDVILLSYLILSYLITAVLVAFASEKRHDYYFSLILDGTIIIQFLFMLLTTV